MSGCIVCCNTGWALIEYILYCHILWWIFYYFLLLVTRQSEEWCCRFLTLVHGCLISYSAIKDILVNKSPIDFQSIPLSQEKKSYLSYMLSYFLFDFCWIHFFGNETWVIYAHHAASILIIINVLLKNYGGAGVSYGVAGLELTNPYLQLRWFLRTHGYLNKPIHTVTELWFMLLFFIIRIIGGTVLLYYALALSQTDFGMKLSFLSIYGISLVLQWQIFVYFRKKYLSSTRLRSVSFINSRVSISPYFQRRTLDHSNHKRKPEDEAPKDNATVVMAVSSATTTEIFSAKEESSSLQRVVSVLEESGVSSADLKLPKDETSTVSIKKEPSLKSQSSVKKNSSTKTQFSVKKEPFVKEEPPEEQAEISEENPEDSLSDNVKSEKDDE